MRRTFSAGIILSAICLTAASAVLSLDRHPTADAVTAAAVAWRDALDADQRQSAVFPFDHAERFRWHYFPHSGPGLTLREMTPEQDHLAREMIRSVLSRTGADKVRVIMGLETILQRMEGSSPDYRDPRAYAFTLYGEPGTPPWGWRVDGHHVAVNVTVASDNTIAVTPLFLGSHPAKIPAGPLAGEAVQIKEYFLALELRQSLTPAQQKLAVLAERTPGNIITGPGRADRIGEPQGIVYGALDEKQQAQLMRLIETYVGTARDEIGQPYLDLVRGESAQLRFAWAGDAREGGRFYYRVHGPRILIEFDNTQDGGNHIHSIWRDPVGDFGGDVLREHYVREHQ